MPRGERTELACPKCGGRMGELSVRAERTFDSEPGFPAIGRECYSCGHRELKEKPLTIRCAHDERERVYHRQPRPSRLREPHAWRCLKCKRIL